MNKTSIEWVRNPDGTQGYTWNPITGCLNGCPYCYARRLANTRMKGRILERDTTVVVRPMPSDDPFAPRWYEERIFDPAGRATPSGIFVCNMGELFGPWLDRDWTDDVLDVIRHCPQHRFYLLTKQPQELAKWSPFPANAWVGVSAWDHASFINACHYLEGVEAMVKYVSLEPLLDWILELDIGGFCTAAGVSWVIVGAQTKPSVLPNWKWVEDICRRCEGAGIALFLKNSLRYLVEDEHFAVELLQEFPKAVRQ